MKVAGRRSTAFRTSAGSKLGNMTSVAPICPGRLRQKVRPKAWKNGSTPYTVSSPGRNPTQASPCTRFATRLRCESMAAFGVPVVPPVYWSSARSSPPTDADETAAGSSPSPACRSRSCQSAMSRGTSPRNASLFSRAAATGRRSNSWERRGRSRTMSRLTTWVSGVPGRAASTRSTALCHTIAIPGARVDEQVVQLVGGVRGVQLDRHSAESQHRVVGDDVGAAVGEHQRDPLSRSDPEAAQGHHRPPDLLVGLRIGQGGAEEVQRDPVGPPFHGTLEGGRDGLVRDLDPVRHPRRVVAHPRPVAVCLARFHALLHLSTFSPGYVRQFTCTPHGTEPRRRTGGVNPPRDAAGVSARQRRRLVARRAPVGRACCDATSKAKRSLTCVPAVQRQSSVGLTGFEPATP